MKAIDHLNRYVSNVDKFIDFYIDVLDYELIDKGIKVNGKNYGILKGNGHELFISENDNFILDKDQEVIVKPFSRQFYIKDPDGFEIDLIQWTDKNKFYNHLKDKNIK